jgi:hypothetical protein
LPSLFRIRVSKKENDMTQTTSPADAVASSSWFQAQFDALKAKAIALWQAFEGDVAQLAVTLLPELEVDVETALESFGAALVTDAIGLLTGGSSAGETASTVATNLIQTIEAQGKTIGLATANTAAQQVTSAALAGLQQVAAQIPQKSP